MPKETFSSESSSGRFAPSSRSCAIVFFAALAAWFVTDHLRVSPTASLSDRVFWASRAPRDIAEAPRGAYVIFDRYLPEPRGEVRSLIKRIACSEGETLAVEGDYYFCDDSYIGMAKHRTLRGGKLTPFVFNGTIPKGKLFVVGDHRDSYDSRYWGFVDRGDVDARAWGLF